MIKTEFFFGLTRISLKDMEKFINANHLTREDIIQVLVCDGNFAIVYEVPEESPAK